jgi:hypothetical protein
MAASVCPVPVPVLKNAAGLDPSYRNAVVVGNAAQNPLAGALLTAWGESDATTDYPGAGSYFVKQNTNALAPAGAVVVVAGPDSAGTGQGVRSTAAFLRGASHWIVP